MTDLPTLISMLEKAEAGGRELDALVAVASGLATEINPKNPERVRYIGEHSDFYLAATPVTRSLDAAVALVERLLPGWLYSVCHCHVSDDAWLMPDFNDPAHSERLMREFGQVEGDPAQYWQDVTDVALHPPHGLALALVIALMRALEALEARG